MHRRELQAMLERDDRHWWYRGRRRILHAVLDRLELPPGARILDAGCGSGRTLDELHAYGSVAGVDVDPTAVAAALRRRRYDVRLGRIEELPWRDGHFDAITCLDVIEHTPDDRRALRELRRVTAPGGFALVTVPAYGWLWSDHDIVNHHQRRYSARSLRLAARDAGWAVTRTTHFNTLLFPPAALVRLGRRIRSRRPPAEPRSERASDLAMGERFNGALELPLRAEAAVIRAGARLPFGLSLLAVLEQA